jgi:hypothetical protein
MASYLELQGIDPPEELVSQELGGAPCVFPRGTSAAKQGHQASALCIEGPATSMQVRAVLYF